MEARRIFEGKTLPTVEQGVSMISIDTIERQWASVSDIHDINEEPLSIVTVRILHFAPLLALAASPSFTPPTASLATTTP